MLRNQDIVNSSDILEYSNRLKIFTTEQEKRKINAKMIETDILEKKLLHEDANTCTVSKLINFQDHLENIDSFQMKKLLHNNFYDPIIMKNIMCTVNSLFYLQPQQPGSVYPNERLKHWLNNLKQIGKDSAYGYAFRTNFDDVKNMFVIKVPKSERNDLLHEFLVGMELNSLRRYIPNFSYVFGGFRCSSTVLREESNILGRPVDRSPVNWCNNSGSNVEYIVYENIAPAVELSEYVKSCTFEQFLDKYLQILYSLLLAQDLKNFSHNDLHTDNILIRKMDQNVSIPYTTEKNIIEYVNTDGIATFIDYGLSMIKLSDEKSSGSGKSIGVYGLEKAGLYGDTLIPLYDAYKILMFSLFNMLINKNHDCLGKCEKLFRFFNRSENMSEFLKKHRNGLFTLPLNSKTIKVTLVNLIEYIRLIPETNKIVTIKPFTAKILGCTGNEICVTDGKAVNILGYNTDKQINDVFDYYDLVSRFEQEGRLDDIDHVRSLFDVNVAIGKAYNEFNNDIENIDSYFYDDRYETVSIKNLNLNNIRGDIYEEYKNYLIRTAEINETFRHVTLIYDAIKFVSMDYPFDTYDLDLKQQEILMLYNDFGLIMDQIKKDAIYLGQDNIEKLNLPELQILANLQS